MECARLGQACLRGGNRGAPDRISLRFYGLTLAPSGEALTDSQKSAAAWAAIVALCVLTLWLLAPVLAGLLEFSATAGPSYALTMVAVVFGMGQVLESFFLTPRLVGERIGLHPVAVIFALMAFGQLFGFVGILVALPASAVLLVAIRRLRSSYMASGLYQR